MDGDLTVIQIGVLSRIVDQSRDLPLPHLASTETEDEEQRVNDIGLSGTVRANYG